MARPSLKQERRVQILDAFAHCVARHGVEGATLERVAEAAGLARALIRHNVGNREELLDLFLERFFDGALEDVRQMISELPADRPSATLVEWLFDPDHISGEDVLIANAVLAYAVEHPSLAARMRTWMDDFLREIEAVLAKDFRGAPAKDRAAVAAGIAGAYFNYESYAPIEPPPHLGQASKRAAELLLQSLREQASASTARPSPG